jgi:hypothetical protein
MADFALDGRFGLVIIPFRSFLQLLTVEQQKACLARIHDHLVDGGRLALNVFNPPIPYMASWLRTRPRLETEVWISRHDGTTAQQLNEARAEVRLSDDGAVIARIERNLRLRYVFRDEMERLLALSGFAVEALYGWFDGRPFDDESSEMVWLARKNDYGNIIGVLYINHVKNKIFWPFTSVDRHETHL